MKKLLLALLIVAMGWLSLQRHYAAVGHWIYQSSQQAEAWFYGFELQQVAIDEMEFTLYQHSNPGKPVILMLHGFSADKVVWLRFARHLTEHYQILIPDLAGHGDSPYQSDWDYSIAAQSDRLQQLLAALDIPAVHLIGNSMGGFISADFAIRYPQQSLSVTLVDPAGVRSPEPSAMQKMLATGRNPFIIQSREQFDQFYAMTMAQPPLVPDIVLEAVYLSYQSRQARLQKIFDDFHQSQTLEPQLHKLKAPAMLWWGSEDQLLHVSATELWQAGIEQLEVHVFEGIGHMPMLEIPSETASLYQEFLHRINTPTPAQPSG